MITWIEIKQDGVVCTAEIVAQIFTCFADSKYAIGVFMDIKKALEHIGRLARMSFFLYRGRRFERRQQYVVSLSKTLYLHCFSRLSCEMSTRWGQPHEGCSVL